MLAAGVARLAQMQQVAPQQVWSEALDGLDSLGLHPLPKVTQLVAVEAQPAGAQATALSVEQERLDRIQEAGLRDQASQLL